ncbi:hypothetical protein BH18ACT9_BH18ACT9_01260 [soil metagenome]
MSGCLPHRRTGRGAGLGQGRTLPTVSEQALAEGLAAVFTFPLRDGDRRLGALDLYRTTAGALDAEAMVAAQTLADVTTAYLLNAQSRFELKAASERAHQRSLHDALTGLPNRSLLMERLEHAVLRGRRSGEHVAVLFVDLDRFKEVNDTFGHQMGDELLIAVANRITGLLRPGDTLARLAGDEFVVLCEGLDDLSQAELVANRLGGALAQPFNLAKADVLVTASVGVAFAGDGLPVPEQLLHEADVAMYQVKKEGGSSYGAVAVQALSLADHLVRLNHDLRGAHQRGELRPEYQPIVAVASQRVVGAEALLRWEHPSLVRSNPRCSSH